MSIFSRLLKRGPEDGGTPPPETSEQPPAAKPAPVPPATREAAPAPSPAPPAPVAGKNESQRPEPKPAAPAGAGGIAGATKAYQAVKPASAVPALAPGMVPPRNTPARTAPAAAPPAARAATAAPEAPPKPAPGRPVMPERDHLAREAREARDGKSARDAKDAKDAKDPKDAKNAKDARAAREAKDEAQPTVMSVDQMFEKLFPGGAAGAPGPTSPPAAAADPALAASDRRAVMATFEELAVGHTAQVRSFMLEVRWGEAQASWIELARPALKSLRAMSIQMDHVALTSALDGFDAALGEMLRPGAPPVIAPPARDKLLAAYAPLIAAMPRAFELEGERDRREPLVVRALLQQVPGLDPLMIDKMTAAGLGRLDALFRAKADEIAAVAGIATEVATATAARLQAFRQATPAALATPDLAATARELGAQVKALEADHRAFEEAASGWSEADREAKKRLRRKREVTSLQITVTLARLGEIDLALRLEKCSFARRLEELERLAGRLAPLARAATAVEVGAIPVEGQIRAIDRESQSGAHAAP